MNNYICQYTIACNGDKERGPIYDTQRDKSIDNQESLTSFHDRFIQEDHGNDEEYHERKEVP